MVGQVKTVNGVKKIVPLTAEARAGNPVSTIIGIYSNLVPSGYLPCNGVQFDETQYPALYAILGDNHTPDLRECTLRGAGQNTTDSIATHDVYEVGEFKDDQLQDHAHNEIRHSEDYTQSSSWWVLEEINTYNYGNKPDVVGARTGRYGNVTRGKSKGINYCIKATAGLDESDADYVLGVLAPVDEVTLNNMHSVTSNAVAEAINNATIYETYQGTYYNLARFGRVITFNLYGQFTPGTSIHLETLPSKYKPYKEVRGVFIRNSNDSPVGQIVIRIDGTIDLYSGVGSMSSDTYCANLTWILA